MASMLDNQTAIVTGAGRGIGAATAKLMAEQGARVVVSDLDAELSAATADAITSAGGEAISVPGDVMDTAFPDRIMKATI